MGLTPYLGRRAIVLAGHAREGQTAICRGREKAITCWKYRFTSIQKNEDFDIYSLKQIRWLRPHEVTDKLKPYEKYKMYLSINLKNLREIKRLSYTDLFMKTGINPQTLQSVENGRTVTNLRNLKALADFYQVSMDDLIFKKLYF